MSVIELIRVVAVSPGDVQAERDVLQSVIDELNRGVAPARGRRLSLWRWETDARPGLHLDGPQGAIDEQMGIQNADLVIGVFWKRFGTPTHAAQSGTAHELRRAWAAWEKSRHPDVMVYFCGRPYAPKSTTELEQWQQVLEFRDAMPEQQLWWCYMEIAEFERLAREHLTSYLLALPDAESTGMALRRRVATGKMSPDADPKQVFLCHSSADKEHVRALYQRLVSDGFVPWLDEEDLVPGASWELATKNALRDSDFVIVCLSRASTTTAGYVHKEIKQALDIADARPDGTIFVIPARIEQCDVPHRLHHLHWVDLFAEGGYSRLITALRGPPQGSSFAT